ncbi:MFS transporter [Lampropedia puyangensis]|uniref:MFS transporter n=1 Tax=Lampropedia puyangensis TaxID=1330072 RepID=A0A4S8FGU0_9BURK|nr:MFS transporter [Lampropedia puyangensis]THU05072.1 MFS transporter [Lampropedia puyangensis]
MLIAIQWISMGAMELSNPFWPLVLQEMMGDVSSDPAGRFPASWSALASTGVYVLPMLGMAMSSVWWGRLGDRCGHRWMMVRALLGLGLSQLGLAMAASPSEVLVWRFVQGLLAGFIAPAQAYGAQLLQGQRPHLLFAALQMATNLGSVAGALLGGLLWQWLPFASLNALAAVLCAFCAWAVIHLLPRQTPHPARSPALQTHESIPGNPDQSKSAHHVLPCVMAALGLLVLARLLMQMPWSLYTHGILQMTSPQIGMAYSLMAAGFCCAALGWAHWAQRLSPANTLGLQIALIVGLACLACAIASVRSVWLFWATQLAMGALLAGTTPVLTAWISRQCSDDQRGQVLGCSQSISQWCSAVGVCAGGALVHGGWLSSIYLWMGGAFALAALPLTVAYTQIRRG